MSDSNNLPEPAEAALPRAPVLSYLTNFSTPTRVRKLAAIGVALSAALYLILAAILLCIIALDVWETAQMFAGWHGGAPPSIHDYVDALKYQPPLALACFGMAVICGVMLVIFIAPVYRGRKVPCILTLVMLLPLFPVLFLLVVGIVVGVVMMFAMERGRQSLLPGLLLLFVPPGVLAILLLKDLCAFLLWIARHPITDKPPVAFLPTKVLKRNA